LVAAACKLPHVTSAPNTQPSETLTIFTVGATLEELLEELLEDVALLELAPVVLAPPPPQPVNTTVAVNKDAAITLIIPDLFMIFFLQWRFCAISKNYTEKKVSCLLILVIEVI
jgi:hypothetical protein